MKLGEWRKDLFLSDSGYTGYLLMQDYTKENIFEFLNKIFQIEKELGIGTTFILRDKLYFRSKENAMRFKLAWI
jgi:hypothetical protein